MGTINTSQQDLMTAAEKVAPVHRSNALVLSAAANTTHQGKVPFEHP